MTVVAAVLLAAGSASRMGLRPKCLLELDGVPLVRRQLAALAGAGVHEIVVVLGHYAERIEPMLEGLGGLRAVRHPDPNVSQAASLHLGLRAVSRAADCVVVALADQPLVNAQDLLELMQAWLQRPDGTRLLQPVVEGKPGNPVLFDRAVGDAILMAGGEMTGRQWQAANPQHVHRWVSANAHYCIDIDTPEDISALVLRTGSHLRWPDGSG